MVTQKTTTKKGAAKAKTLKGPQQSATKAPADATTVKRVSAIDAAARVLQETITPLTTAELIEQMAAKGYWTSPSGKTPAATLCSAILREIEKKGGEARFKKAERGKYAYNG